MSCQHSWILGCYVNRFTNIRFNLFFTDPICILDKMNGSIIFFETLDGFQNNTYAGYVPLLCTGVLLGLIQCDQIYFHKSNFSPIISDYILIIILLTYIIYRIYHLQKLYNLNSFDREINMKRVHKRPINVILNTSHVQDAIYQ